MAVFWKRTAPGDAELRTRAVALSAASRNLLMIVDGVKSEELFLDNLVGVTEADFRRLSALGLIERKLDGRKVAAATAQAAQPASSHSRLLAESLRAVVSEHLGLSGVAVDGEGESQCLLDSRRVSKRKARQLLYVDHGHDFRHD